MLTKTKQKKLEKAKEHLQKALYKSGYHNNMMIYYESEQRKLQGIINKLEEEAKK